MSNVLSTGMHMHIISFATLQTRHNTHCFLKKHGKRACIQQFSITQYKFQPSLFLRLGKYCQVSLGDEFCNDELTVGYRETH